MSGGRESNRMQSALFNTGGSSGGSAMVYDLTVADRDVLQCGICFLPLKSPIFQCVVGHALCSSCSNKLKNTRNCHLCRVAMPDGYRRCHAMERVVNSLAWWCTPRVVLQCGVCFLPLKPPIFQCVVGHALCSSCSKKLKNARNCNLCGVAMPDGYQRCHAMEDMVNSICVPCPHAPLGCDTRPVYHTREEHILECAHAPCHCPGNGCSFVGPVATLIKHLTAAHGWPCTAEVCADMSFVVNLRDGFNFITAVRGGAQYLFLLNMASTPFGHAISAVWIRSLTAMAISSSTSKNTTCELDLFFLQFAHPQFQRGHYQKSRFQVECMCPSNGLLPDPNTSFQFFVPKYVGGNGNEAPVHVTIHATIHVTLKLGSV